jgi:chromosome segregation ATPase
VPSLVGAALVAALVAIVPVSVAQTPRSGGGGGANAQAMQQLQQLGAERTQLQAENARLKKELDALKASTQGEQQKKGALEARAARAEAAAQRTAAEKAQSEQSAQQSRAKLDELIAKYRELADTLRTVEGERTALAARNAELGRASDRCAQANVELSTISLDVLQRYENAGFGHAVGRAEPFTQLTRTRVENLVDEYRARVRELTPAADGAKGAAR